MEITEAQAAAIINNCSTRFFIKQNALNSAGALPKSFRHWCRLARLRPHAGTGRQAHAWYYLKGHGRVWRINCHGEFECGDTYAEFDRWALCTIESMPLPTTKAAFLAAVKQLLAAHKENNK